MIFSMTGFGNAEVVKENINIIAEIRSVNSRFMEISAKTPRIFFQKESSLKEIAKKYLERGKITISVIIKSSEFQFSNLSVDNNAVSQYVNLLK